MADAHTRSVNRARLEHFLLILAQCKPKWLALLLKLAKRKEPSDGR